jgi:hypothetical protein
MADITMCDGLNCARKSECYRHTARQNEYRQSWFVKSPVDALGLCEEFISNGNADSASNADGEE